MPDQQLVRTVLELDLASYADIARVLEENLDVAAVKAFEDQIQSFVDRGLESVGLNRADVVLGTAGDNAVLIFDRPELMHEFARAVQEATVAHNEPKTVDAAKRWFRMGAATGTLLILESERRIVGSTVTRAVRLEAAAAKGELVVDVTTYQGLPESLKQRYGPEELVRGKRDETFRVRRCKMISLEKLDSQGPPQGSDSSALTGAGGNRIEREHCHDVSFEFSGRAMHSFVMDFPELLETGPGWKVARFAVDFEARRETRTQTGSRMFFFFSATMRSEESGSAFAEMLTAQLSSSKAGDWESVRFASTRDAITRAWVTYCCLEDEAEAEVVRLRNVKTFRLLVKV